jgi:FkbM family methyltransferase
MRNVFLDLGTHFGGGLFYFIQRFNITPDWSVHTFEANPITFDIFSKEHAHKVPFVTRHNLAVSDNDGTITLNLESPPNEGDTGMASSIIEMDNWNPWGNRHYFTRKEEIRSIDISKFIQDNFVKEDFIVIKMDIEGSEYRILDKMIADGTIDYIDHLSVEWHSKFFVNLSEMQQKEAELRSKLSSISTLHLEEWH